MTGIKLIEDYMNENWYNEIIQLIEKEKFEKVPLGRAVRGGELTREEKEEIGKEYREAVINFFENIRRYLEWRKGKGKFPEELVKYSKFAKGKPLLGNKRAKKYSFFTLLTGLSVYIYHHYTKVNGFEEKQARMIAIYEHFGERWSHHLNNLSMYIKQLEKMGYDEISAREIAYSYLLGHLIFHNNAKRGEKRITNEDKRKMIGWINGFLVQEFGIRINNYNNYDNGKIYLSKVNSKNA